MKHNLDTLFSTFNDQWSPKVAAELNGQQVRLVKLQGEFVWHSHADEDEMFLVHKGRLTMQFRDHTVELEAGDFIIVPRGVEHCPRADEEAHVVLFEPKSVVNTGSVVNERTVQRPQSIASDRLQS